MADEQKVRELLDRGLTYYGLGQVQQALDVWQQALQLDPENVRAREYIEFVRLSWGPPGHEASPPSPPPAEEPVADASVFAQPPLQESPVEAAAPLSKEKPSFLPPQSPPAQATGWGELFSGSSFEPAAEQAGPSFSFPQAGGSSTLPPYAPPPAEASPPPAPFAEQQLWQPASDAPPVPAAAPEPAELSEFGAATVSYQAVPTRMQLSVPTQAVPATADALALVAGDIPATAETAPPADEKEAWLKGAADMLELDDCSGALELLDKILATWPDNQQALSMREQATRKLGAMFRSKVGALSRIPKVRMAADEIIWLNLDHRAGFLLSLIDGRTSFDEIMSVCGLPEVEALRLFAQLLQEGVIETV